MVQGVIPPPSTTKAVTVPQWLRNLIMLVITGMWCTYMIATFLRGDEIPAAIWGVIPGAYVALNPPRLPWGGGSGDAEGPRVETTAPNGGGGQ